jgi:hypothetical protein
MSDCDIDGETLSCRVCGAVVSSPNTRRNCGTRPARTAAGLGDMVAAGLDAIGITKERAQAVASAFGVSDCGCAARQEALNRAFPFGPRPPENPPPATIDQSGEAAGPR